jgi:ParB/RepB/Spo0J family partition protein
MAKQDRAFNGVTATQQRIQKQLDERNEALKAQQANNPEGLDDEDIGESAYGSSKLKKKHVSGQSASETTRAPISASTENSDSKALACRIGRTLGFRYVDSAKIKSWSHKDRTELELFDDPEFQELVVEVGQVGVIQNVILRLLPKTDKDGHEYEEIVGFKRITAAKIHAQPVPAEIRELTDIEAFRLQITENKGRSKPSFWSIAVAFAKLDEEFGATQQARADNVGLTKSQASTCMRLWNNMPDDVVRGVKLHRLGYNALVSLIVFLDSKSPRLEERIDMVVEHADEFDAKPAKAEALVKRLEASFTSGEGANNTDAKPAGVIVKSQYGKAMTFKASKTGYSVTVHESAKNVATMQEVQEVLSEFLANKGLDLSSSEEKQKG